MYAHIEIVEASTDQYVAAGVSKLILSRRNEAGRIEPRAYLRIRDIAIANAVWPGCISRVGVIST